jgi:hypothetical protein
MDERVAKIIIMNINQEELSLEFNKNVKFNYDLKKKIGLI